MATIYGVREVFHAPLAWYLVIVWAHSISCKTIQQSGCTTPRRHYARCSLLPTDGSDPPLGGYELLEQYSQSPGTSGVTLNSVTWYIDMDYCFRHIIVLNGVRVIHSCIFAYCLFVLSLPACFPRQIRTLCIYPGCLLALSPEQSSKSSMISFTLTISKLDPPLIRSGLWLPTQLYCTCSALPIIVVILYYDWVIIDRA